MEKELGPNKMSTYNYQYRDYLDEADVLSKIRCETGDHVWVHHFKMDDEWVERCDYLCGMIRALKAPYSYSSYSKSSWTRSIGRR